MAYTLNELNIDLIAEYISHGHAYDRHLLGRLSNPNDTLMGQNAYRLTNPYVGPDLGITTPNDLQNYVGRMLDDPGTVGFRSPRDGSLTLYNSSDNTLLFIDASNKTLTHQNGGDFGTVV